MSIFKRISAATKVALFSSATLGATGGVGCALASQYMAMGMGAKVLAVFGIGGASLVSAPVLGGAVVGGVTVAGLAYAYACGKSLIVKTETLVQSEGFRDGPESQISN